MENTTSRPNVFKNKNFALLFSGVLVSHIAHILFNFAMSLYVLQIAKEAFGDARGPEFQGYYLLVAGIVLVILMPFGGVFADRLNKVKTMYVTDFIRGLTIIIAGVLLFYTPDPKTKIIFLFIMAIILGINSAFFQPASGSLLKFIVHEDDLQQASSYLHGSYSLQNIIGLILGGIFYASFGIYVIFFINGIGYIISGITEMFIKYDAKIATEKTSVKLVLGDIASGVKYVFNFKALFTLLMMALFLNFFVSPIYQNALPYFVTYDFVNETTWLFKDFISQASWYSIILIASSVSSIIMSIILSSSKPKEKYHRQINTALVLFVILCTLNGTILSLYNLGYITINTTLVVVTTAMFFMGFMQIAFNVPVSVYIQKSVDKDHLGKVQSVLSVLSSALIPIGGMLAGLIISKVSVVALYIFCCVGMLVTTILFIASKNSKLI